MKRCSTGVKAVGLLLVSAGLILFVCARFLTGSQGAHAQEGGRLTWTKLLDRKPAAMAFSPNFAADRLVLIGNSNKDDAHGIWRSTDAGEIWARSDEGIPEAKQIDVYEIVFSPDYARDQTVYASVNKQRLTMGEATGAFFRSTDAGRTWAEIAMTGFPSRGARPLQDLVSLSFSPRFTEDGTLFGVAAAVGLFRSRDRGATWQQLLAENASDIQVSPAYPEDRLVVAATANSGLLFSTDGGDTWTPRNAGLEGARNFKQVVFSSDFQKDRTMLAMSVSSGLFITRNAGESWENLVAPPENQTVILMATTPRFVAEGAVAYSLRNAEIFLSEDLGRTWQPTDSGSILGGQVVAMFMPPDYVASRILYAVSVFGGVFRYHPVEAGSEVALTATAVAVQATATAAAIPTAIAAEQAKKIEDFTETGCISYYIPPIMLIGVWVLRSRSRRGSREVKQ